uniref:Peroxisomal ATPase PEX1 n=1 Tax=Mastacembelus armatus TaxID=205130 RepID=A0A7N8YPY2_9TELE
MFTNQGIQPVAVGFNNIKNCFIHLPSKLVSLSVLQNQALELSWGHGYSVFLSWTQNRTSSSLDGYKVELCRQLGEKLGLKDGEQGFLRPCHKVSSVHQVFVEPLSPDDWEILELHTSALEQHLLDQIRVVFQDAVFPVWVDSHTVIYIRIASLLPSVCYGRLEQFTELVVSPKIRAGIGNPSGFSVTTSEKQRKSDLSSPSGPLLQNTAHTPQSHQWGGIADLKSLLYCMIKGTYDPGKERPPVPDIPALFTDSIYRVCGAAPDSLCSISQVATGVIHLFSWRQTNTGLSGGQTPVTYGLLSKVPSPKETRDRAKQAMEKKKNTGVTKADASVNGNEMKDDDAAMVVRVVCHSIEKLAGEQRSKGKVHRGKVWIPQELAIMLNIIPHSTVRIKPVKSFVKIASTIRLQPLKILVSLKCSTRSFPPSVFLGKNDPECGLNEDPFVCFFFFPFFFSVSLTLLSFSSGIDELSKTGFDFISHSLLGSLLSRELGTNGQGLQGGALLITGAKGSGKSTLSRALCRKAREVLDAHVEVVDCKKLQGKRAETVRQLLQDIFELAEWRHPSVVLLDDLDHVTGAPTSPENEHGPEALLQQNIAQSLKDVVDEVVIHASLVCLIITSQSEHTLHPSLTEVQGSHFIQGFAHIQPPDQAQRADILRHLIIRKATLSQETLQTLDLGFVAKKTEGYTPQDLALLLERAIHANTVQRGHSDQGVYLSWTDFAQALKGFTPPSLWGVDLHTPSGVGLERVGGLSEVRQQLMDTILLPAKYPVLFSNLPIRHRSGILLYGAPGTGKTLLARAVAKDSGMNFISIKGPELLSKYIGASEQGVRDVFQRAQAAKPCILFFDEFDSLAPRRGHDSTGVTDRVVNQLLTQLDGVEGLQGVYVLAATSRPDLIDPALLRPGRLDKSLYCPPPDLEARVEILKALSAGLPVAADVDLEQLAAATEQFTGADLKALLYNAQLEAVHNTELTSGSDSDMSLSSMIFPNNSSGSDDSVGEGDPSVGLDQSTALLEPNETEDDQQCSNVWRLYFGSSYESELGNSPISGLNSQCISGPDSMTHDCTGTSVRDHAGSLPPAYMFSLQTGYEELGLEELDRLQQDINNIKNNSSSQSGLLLCRAHLNSALAVTTPSLNNAHCTQPQYKLAY